MKFAKSSGSSSGVYYLHGDHLGTATYITNEYAEPTQFFLNLPFGEKMEQQQEPTAYVNPYKFNAKELDSETGQTGLYYYGARYYNPRLSIWYGVDPLAVYNPVMETEFYGDGQHNGGVYNLGNLNPYIYCYQNPIRYIDPNGKQVDKVIDGLEKMWNAVNPWAATESTADGLRVRSSHERFSEFQSGTVQAAKGAATKEVGHALLDVGGLLPVVGEPLDGANAVWYASEGDYLNAGLSVAAAGYAATGTKITVKSLVKTDSKILKLAREAFEGNELLSKEATELVKQAMDGNFNSGKGAKDIGNGIFELRGHKQGARVYYRMKGQVMEILGYSNKTNQQKVIDAIKKKHAK